MAKRHLRLGILVMLLAGLCADASPGAAAPASEPLLITVGLMPEVTRDRTAMVRGVHTPGAVVDIRVNGRLEATGTPEGNTYWAEVQLDRAENRVVSYARLNGATASASRDVFLATVSFADLQGDWAQDPVEALATLGIVSGTRPGLFGPALPASRAEFAKLLVLGLGLEPDETHMLPFRDASLIPVWARGYVATAARNGLVTGHEDHTFGPDGQVSRVQAAVMLARALRLRQVQPTGPRRHFIDDAAIPVWARQDVDLAVRTGLIEGFEDGRFRPLAAIQRRQAAAVVYRMWKATR